MSDSKSSALASPKLMKTMKQTVATVTNTFPAAAYGCEHVQDLLSKERKRSIDNYIQIQQAVAERHYALSHTYKSQKGSENITLTTTGTTYLCLLCRNIARAADKDKHATTKNHPFYIESAQGCLYCHACKDFVYDPTLEAIRERASSKKRKFNEVDNGAEEDYISITNAGFAPCRAVGLRGLYNMGQTCFMSVILQSLVHNPSVRSFYLADGHNSNDCERTMCTGCAMDEIFNEFYATEKPEGFGTVNMLIGSWNASQSLAGYQQQDAHEYMQFILNSLHQANAPSSIDDSPRPSHKEADTTNCPCVIHRTFAGELTSTVTCSSCNNKTTTSDPFLDLSLDIRPPKKKKPDTTAADGKAAVPILSLNTSFNRFTAPETLPASSYNCAKCSSSSATAKKQLLIKQIPETLAVHLKRFEHGGPGAKDGKDPSETTDSKPSKKNGEASKIDTKVKFPVLLDLYPYTVAGKIAGATLSLGGKEVNGTSKRKNERDADAKTNGTTEKGKTERPPQALYELNSVVVHKGTMDSGHYISYSKEGEQWFLFDDSKVTLVGEKEVLNAEAYLLFYVARDCA